MILFMIVFALLIIGITLCIKEYIECGWLKENGSLFVLIATIVCNISILWLIIHMATNF